VDPTLVLISVLTTVLAIVSTTAQITKDIVLALTLGFIIILDIGGSVIDLSTIVVSGVQLSVILTLITVFLMLTSTKSVWTLAGLLKILLPQYPIMGMVMLVSMMTQKSALAVRERVLKSLQKVRPPETPTPPSPPPKTKPAVIGAMNLIHRETEY
jgi:hypothetical protein